MDGTVPAEGRDEAATPEVVEGVSVWRVERPNGVTDISTRDRIELDAERCAWTVRAVAPGAEPVVVADDSRHVRAYIRRVVSEKERATRRATVRPVPKPAASGKKKGAPRPSTTPDEVACPLCRGEAWPDCACCAGDGWVSPRRAARWQGDRTA